MRRAALFTLVVVCLSGFTLAQDAKKDAKKDDAPKAKGFLPMNWKELGLTDEQKQKVYTIHNKYNDQIDKLDAEIKALKEKRDKERLTVLTGEQKKRLEEILKAKAGTK